MNVSAVETYYQQHHKDYHASFDLRISRALSWLKQANIATQDLDFCFIALWIAFNAAYARELEHTSAPSDRSDSQQFLRMICRIDKEQRIYRLLWETFPNHIRILLDNPYTFQHFWNYHNGLTSETAWQEYFMQENQRARQALAEQDAGTLLTIVFGRLYTLRNQIVHGGAIYNSQYNRDQLRDGCAILKQCIPLILYIMQEHHALADWGKPFYPHIEI